MCFFSKLHLNLEKLEKKKMPFFGLFSILLFGLLSRSQLVMTQMLDSDQGLILLQIQTEFHVSKWSAQNTSDFCIQPGISCNNSLVESLDLSNQGLRGNLTLISQLKSLKSLDLSFNNFNGFIPPALAELSELEFLDLSFNNFDGPIPSEFSRLKNLRALHLSSNFLTGDIPKELDSLKKLESLHLFTNRLNGTIPSWVANLTGLRIFTAYENDLTGFIPDELGLHNELQLLNLHSNELEGPIPESIFSMQKLETLVLTQNRLSGYIPKSIGKCKTLSSVRIGNNNLSGLIPREIGDISSLTYFEANENGLYGEIVPEFSKCTNLTLLNLASNRFNGTVPLEFGLLSNLQELILSDNDLFGEMPLSILRVRSLNKLDLSYNQFNGTIPASICNASRLLQFLLLEHNSLEGEIPHEIGNCTKLLELQLGSNRLSGSIPPEIGHIKNLQIALNLSSNHLNGQLPEELGRLDKLVALDVSGNRLTGNIPSAFRGMLSLIEVNFSNNQFSGPIPLFVPFQKSPNSSFIGNKALCGEPLTVPCGNSDDFNSGSYSYHHKVSYKIVLTVIGSGLAVFASVSVVVLLFMMREKQEKAAKEAKMAEEEINEDPKIIAGNVFIESLKQAIDFEAVAKATMKESSKLSVGTFSVVYKADMPSGVILSVRKLKSMVHKTVLNHQSKMIREVEKLSKLRHDNLMRPIGFVLFEEDVVLLLHQYYPNGTLAQFLHGPGEKPDYKPDWPVRLAIAIGVAEGLAFLHNVAIIHLDISSGNVVLDSSFNPLLGEVEVSKLLDPSRGTASISAVAGSFGYIPPEYAYTMQVTAPGNVYSYGVVLLEILTTRLPVDEAFGEGIDLVKWVHGAPTRGETPEQILDPRLSTVSFGWRKEMLAALKVALLCTDNTPAKRPKMKNVVEMMKEIGKN